MGSAPCRQCAAQISTEARTCPHCGCSDPTARAAVAAAEAPPERKWQFQMLPAEALGERRIKLPSVGGKAPYAVAAVLYAIAALLHGKLDGAYGVGIVFGTLLVALLILWAVKAMPFSRWRGVIFLVLSVVSLWRAPWHVDPRQARWKAMAAEDKTPATYQQPARRPGR